MSTTRALCSRIGFQLSKFGKCGSLKTTARSMLSKPMTRRVFTAGVMTAMVFPSSVALCDSINVADAAKKAADGIGGGASDDDSAINAVAAWLDATLRPVGGEMTMGVAMGFCSGAALKQAGRAAATTIGVLFMFVQGMSYMGYLNINWGKAEKDARQAMDADGDGKITAADFKVYAKKLFNVLKYQLPSSSGFTLGLFLGMKYA